MKNIYLGTKKAIDRRTFLQAAGATIALPLLEAMSPAFAASGDAPKVPRRMVAIETNMRIMPQFFFPEKAGADYALTPYLQKLAAHRKNMTVFSGVSLPGVTGGHAAEKCFLTGTPHPERGGFRNGVSLDHLAAHRAHQRGDRPLACTIFVIPSTGRARFWCGLPEPLWGISVSLRGASAPGERPTVRVPGRWSSG